MAEVAIYMKEIRAVNFKTTVSKERNFKIIIQKILGAILENFSRPGAWDMWSPGVKYSFLLPVAISVVC
jgi:hypothetical protein